MRNFLKPLSFLPAILLMYMIFSFSSQPGDVSTELSLKVSSEIVRTADYVFDANLNEGQVQNYAQKINFITRKLAHMTEYFALALAVSFPLYVYGLHGILLMLVAGVICVGFACGDEFHQSMVAGRTPAVRDVMIDSFGIFWGIVLVRIIGWTGRKTIFRPKKKKPKKNRQPDYYQEPEDYDQSPNRKKGYSTYPNHVSWDPNQQNPQQLYRTGGQPYGQPYPNGGQPYSQPYPNGSQPYGQPYYNGSQSYSQPYPNDGQPYNQSYPNGSQPYGQPYGTNYQPRDGQEDVPYDIPPRQVPKKKPREKDWFFDL